MLMLSPPMTLYAPRFGRSHCVNIRTLLARPGPRRWLAQAHDANGPHGRVARSRRTMPCMHAQRTAHEHARTAQHAISISGSVNHLLSFERYVLIRPKDQQEIQQLGPQWARSTVCLLACVPVCVCVLEPLLLPIMHVCSRVRALLMTFSRAHTNKQKSPYNTHLRASVSVSHRPLAGPQSVCRNGANAPPRRVIIKIFICPPRSGAAPGTGRREPAQPNRRDIKFEYRSGVWRQWHRYNGALLSYNTLDTTEMRISRPLRSGRYAARFVGKLWKQPA